MLNSNHTKIHISKDLSDEIGLTNSLSKKVTDDVILIFYNLIKSGKVSFKNFGTFKFINKNERIGRNPKTKEEFTISSRKSISFKSSKNLLGGLNN